MTTTLNTVAHAPRTKPEFPPKIWLENYGLYITKSGCFASQSEAVVGLLPTGKDHQGALGAVAGTVAVVATGIETVTAVSVAVTEIDLEGNNASASTANVPVVGITDRNAGVFRRPRQTMRRSACWSTT